MKSILKSETGISGLDEITNGGLPLHRPTLICGGPGCGKTLMAMEFLIKGATVYNEPGVFLAFEEKVEELSSNVASLGFDVEKLQKTKKLKIDYVHIDRTEIAETGEYDLEGLFIRLNYAIDNIGAKRVVLDTVENLFSGLKNEAILRTELRRLFQWLKDKGVTAIITAEKGDGSLTRYGIEEYVSDCVILLDHRVIDQISTRRLRIVKYRGSVHGTNEYPFLIDDDGISVLPVTSMRLEKTVLEKRISTGIPALDKMLDSKGFYAGSSILISGSAGTGKTSIASYFANASCLRKERCLYFAFEESPQQIIRNMKSINLDLQKHVKSDLLQFHAYHPAESGLEMHLVRIFKLVKQFKPKMIIIDPVTNLINAGMKREVKSMLMRLIDRMQSEGVTAVFTALSSINGRDQTDEDISSLVDAWLQVRDLEMNGERNRGMYVMKSRGMGHSNQIREFLISDKGLDLVDIYLGPDGILIGSAREQAQKLHSSSSAERSKGIEREKMARIRQDGSPKSKSPARKKGSK